MTDAQKTALNQCKEILTEHFEAHVLIVHCEIGDKKESTRAFWSGGYAMARGLMEIGIDQHIQIEEDDADE